MRAGLEVESEPGKLRPWQQGPCVLRARETVSGCSRAWGEVGGSRKRNGSDGKARSVGTCANTVCAVSRQATAHGPPPATHPAQLMARCPSAGRAGRESDSRSAGEVGACMPPGSWQAARKVTEKTDAAPPLARRTPLLRLTQAGQPVKREAQHHPCGLPPLPQHRPTSSLLGVPFSSVPWAVFQLP